MKKYVSYRLLLIGLVLLLISSAVACSSAPSSVTSQTQPPAPSEPATKKPAAFEVESITVKPTGIMVGDSATVSANIKNTGDVIGTYTAILAIDGKEVERKDISVEPQVSKPVGFSITNVTAGNYELAVGKSSAILTVYDWSPYEIKYDIEFGRTVSLYGERGHIVHFTPPTRPFKLQRIKICASTRYRYMIYRYGHKEIADFKDLEGRNFTVRIWNHDKSKILWSGDFPWLLFKGTSAFLWEGVDVPDVRVDGDFHIEVVTHSGTTLIVENWTIYESTLSIVGSFGDAGTRSGYSIMGSMVEPPEEILRNPVWLIRAEGEGAPSQLSYDDGKAEGGFYTTNNSHLVLFSPTSSPFELHKINVFGFILTTESQRAEGRRFIVRVWDKSTGTKLWEQDFPWNLFSLGVAKWVDLIVPNIKCNGDFYVELTTNSIDQNCCIVVDFDSSTPNKHSDMSVDGKIISWKPWTLQGITYTREKVNWMIRVG